MNKIIMAALGLGLMASAQAADTSVTIIRRGAVTPVGTSPQLSYVHADATSAAASAGRMTFDLPAPRGTSNIIGFLPVAQNVSGGMKPLNITRSGNTVTVASSNQTSGTLAVSDTVRVITIYQP